jgi:hypothetical protein
MGPTDMPPISVHVNFGFEIAACVAGILNPIKFLGAPGSALVALIDCIMGMALGILQSLEAFLPSKSATGLSSG